MKSKRIQSNKEFEEVLNQGVAMIDFNAPWCGPCHSQEPIIDEIADRYMGKATVALLNIDNHQDLAVKFGIEKVPTLIVFKNSKELHRFVGLQPASSLMDAMEKALN